jgi:hypothetical protein
MTKHKPYDASWFRSPVDLPEATSGKISIRHRILKPGTETPIVGFRQAFLRGMRPANALIKASLRVHELVHENMGVWMTDLPEELNQIAEMLYTINPQGNVLVGGLGLGILAMTLVERTDADRVTVVEIDPDVIKLCAQPGYDVINADIEKFLQTTDKKFDFYLLDTWQGTNEGTWWSKVLPLRRVIRQRWGKNPVVHCWAEDIMQGQILRSLITKEPHWYYGGLPMPMTPKTARQFLRDVGLPSWERRYGKAIDDNLTKMNKERDNYGN